MFFFRTAATGQSSAQAGDARAGIDVSGSPKEVASNPALCCVAHGTPAGASVRAGLRLHSGLPRALTGRGQQFRARLLAAAARFGADAAMLVHAAQAAQVCAHLKQGVGAFRPACAGAIAEILV